MVTDLNIQMYLLLFTYLAASIQTLPTPHMAEEERLCQDPLHVILDWLIYLDKWASRSD